MKNGHKWPLTLLSGYTFLDMNLRLVKLLQLGKFEKCNSSCGRRSLKVFIAAKWTLFSELSAHRAGIKNLLKYEGLGVLCWLLHTPYIREPQTDTAIDSIAKIWQCFVFMLQLTCNMGGVFLYLLMWLVVVSDKYLGCLPAPPRLPVCLFFPLHCDNTVVYWWPHDRAHYLWPVYLKWDGEASLLPLHVT